MHVTINQFDLSSQIGFFSLSVCFVSLQCQYSVTGAGSLGPQVLSPQSSQPENPLEATGTFLYITNIDIKFYCPR